MVVDMVEITSSSINRNPQYQEIQSLGRWWWCGVIAPLRINNAQGGLVVVVVVRGDWWNCTMLVEMEVDWWIHQESTETGGVNTGGGGGGSSSIQTW